MPKTPAQPLYNHTACATNAQMFSVAETAADWRSLFYSTSRNHVPIKPQVPKLLNHPAEQDYYPMTALMTTTYLLMSHQRKL